MKAHLYIQHKYNHALYVNNVAVSRLINIEDTEIEDRFGVHIMTIVAGFVRVQCRVTQTTSTTVISGKVNNFYLSMHAPGFTCIIVACYCGLFRNNLGKPELIRTNYYRPTLAQVENSPENVWHFFSPT